MAAPPRFFVISMVAGVLAGMPRAEAKDSCLDCHAEKDAMPAKNLVEAELFKGTKHSRLECAQCHVDYKGKESGHDEKKGKPAEVNCTTSGCHDQDDRHAQVFAKSVHGQAGKRGDGDAPKCRDCHGTHRILPASDPLSRANPRNIEQVCIKCHTDSGIISRHHLPNQERIKEYELTVHWGSRQKVGGVAYCTNCHGGHQILPAADPQSTVNRWNIAAMCGTCHDGIFTEFKRSVHGQAYLARNKDVPVCTDCHGAHTIKGKDAPSASTYPTNIATMCLRCHDKERLAPNLSLTVPRGKSYFASYHGIANIKGDISVANCASCHGSHNIHKSSDPESMVNAANIPKTCGKCHPGAGVNYSLGVIHAVSAAKTSATADIIAKLYTVVIIATVGGFLGLIALDLYGRFIHRRRED